MIETKVMQSQFLGENVKLKLVTPVLQPIEKVLILLHGKKNCDEEEAILDKMVQQLELEALCEEFHLMTVIPCMKNCYYISSEDYNCEKFINKELLEFLGQYNASTLTAEKLLGGISMGGYGAMLIGANTDRFHKVISISGSFIEKDIIIGNPEVWGSRRPTRESAKGSFLYYFLPLDELVHSRSKSVENSLLEFEGRDDKPELYFSCGTKDWLYARNVVLLKILREHHIQYKFYEIPEGQHDSMCFREGLWKTIGEIVKFRG